MAESLEREIAARAYRLWKDAGQPKGRDEELRNEDKSSPLRTPDTL